MDIKTIVDNVTTKASSIAKEAVKKTSAATENAKLAIALKSEKNKLEDLFATLGKLFYEQVKGTDVRVQITAQIMQIDEQKKVIDDLRVTISEAKGKIICESCGKEVDINNAFCPICGNKIEPKFIFEDGSEEDEEAEENDCSDENV